MPARELAITLAAVVAPAPVGSKRLGSPSALTKKAHRQQKKQQQQRRQLKQKQRQLFRRRAATGLSDNGDDDHEEQDVEQDEEEQLAAAATVTATTTTGTMGEQMSQEEYLQHVTRFLQQAIAVQARSQRTLVHVSPPPLQKKKGQSHLQRRQQQQQQKQQGQLVSSTCTATPTAGVAWGGEQAAMAAGTPMATATPLLSVVSKQQQRQIRKIRNKGGGPSIVRESRPPPPSPAVQADGEQPGHHPGQGIRGFRGRGDSGPQKEAEEVVVQSQSELVLARRRRDQRRDALDFGSGTPNNTTAATAGPVSIDEGCAFGVAAAATPQHGRLGGSVPDADSAGARAIV